MSIASSRRKHLRRAILNGGVNWIEGVSTNVSTQWYGVGFGDGTFVAVGANDVMTSTDNGATWTDRSPASSIDWRDVAWDGSLFAAVSHLYSGTLAIMTSSDGITWASRTTPSNTKMNRVIWENSQFVAVGGDSSGIHRCVTSPDGINWTARAGVTGREWFDVAWNGSLYVAVCSSVGTGNVIFTSPTAVTWTGRTATGAAGFTSVAYGAGLFVAVADFNAAGKNIYTSPDGINWTARPGYPYEAWFSKVVYDDFSKMFLAVSFGGTDDDAFFSLDGITWEQSETPDNTNNWWDIALDGAGHAVSVARSGVNTTKAMHATLKEAV